MSLTADQTALGHAYQQIDQAVIDDMTEFCGGLAEPMVKSGAILLVLHVLRRRSMLRRHKKEPK